MSVTSIASGVIQSIAGLSVSSGAGTTAGSGKNSTTTTTPSTAGSGTSQPVSSDLQALLTRMQSEEPGASGHARHHRHGPPAGNDSNAPANTIAPDSQRAISAYAQTAAG
jgi:hypothetical protein